MQSTGSCHDVSNDIAGQLGQSTGCKDALVNSVRSVQVGLLMISGSFA